MKLLFSFKTTFLLLFLLSMGAAVATFIENDFGTSSARVLVYNAIWYELILVLTVINMTGIIFKYKMYKSPARFIFHLSFVVILVGAGITRYVGYEGIMQIKEGQTSNQMFSLEPYLQLNIKYKGKSYKQEFQKEFTAVLKDVNDFAHDIEFEDKNLHIKYINYIYAKKEKSSMGLIHVELSIDGVSKTIKLPGQRGQVGMQRMLDFGKVQILLSYGSKALSLPFSIRLNDFELQRYPGSMSPSSYASEVTVIKADKTSYDYRIFMNTTLSEGTFLFFQSSYFPDESGTVLSVNNDPGKWPTYLGYFLLTFGFIMNFFSKKSRFAKLTKFIKKSNIASFLLLFALIGTTNLKADDTKYLESFKKDSKEVSNKFARLVVQGYDGRMKPMATLSDEIVLKLTGKTSFMGFSSNQIVLGMLSNPTAWREVKIIRISTPKLKKFLSVDMNSKYIAFTDAFKGNEYILKDESTKAFAMSPSLRGTYERELVKIEEKLNIIYSLFNGSLIKIFPRVKDEHNHTDNNTWYAPLEAIKTFEGMNKKAVQTVTTGFMNSVYRNDWDSAKKYLKIIKMYQTKAGSSVNLSNEQIEKEIAFSKLELFPKLTLAYILLGLVMLITSLVLVFNPNIKPKKITFIAFGALALLFAVHTYGMGMRWILSGHAPWSNTYESLLYISWSAVFAGVVFFRKYLLALSGAVIMAGIFMFTAHLSGIDPQLSNLVPVLKSYWLTIHVAIITGSYGFLGLGAILGYIGLLLFIVRSGKSHVDNTIKQIAAIMEISLIIGLVALTIGNFLGGIWANESWGRYWGWDSKETWAYISIVIYVLVLHLRFVKKLDNPFVLSVASTIAFSSILMTYFGVNFYLSGMHSYATGDPVPVPTWVYVTAFSVLVTILLAYRNRKL